MTTVLLAVADPVLRTACRRQLAIAGYAAVEVDRPLSLLGLAARLSWEALYADDSDLGRQSIDVARQVPNGAVIVALGFRQDGASSRLGLPINRESLLSSLHGMAASPPAILKPGLRLDPSGHRALVDESEVRLSVTEYRLLALLSERRPAGVSTEDLLHDLWGEEAASAGASLLRVHVRNLRSKLAAAGLPDAVQSRRGLG